MVPRVRVSVSPSPLTFRKSAAMEVQEARHSHSSARDTQELRSAAIRFAGDSGDGMQLAGTQFTNTTAIFGNDVSTLPDFPAEIRAPAGTLGGVSGFQINFSSEDIYTPGDRVDALIAMNPAALKVNLKDLADGGVLIVNSDEFTEGNLKRASFDHNPLETDELSQYRLHKVPITSHTAEAVKPSGLTGKDAARCKNFYALGLVYWMYDRSLETTIDWIKAKFGKKPEVAQANELALRAGFNFGEISEMFAVRFTVRRAQLPAGRYRNVTGNQAAALGFIAAAKLANKPLFYGSYPITPASEILQELSIHKNYDVRTFQAEDEIAAMGAVVGAAFAGAIGVTGTSGPGLALKQEAIGLAVMTELPCVIVNVQRGGPSTGLPTKTEQADLWQALFGRNGECPVPVVAARSPADCFNAALEATRLAVAYMTPVLMLSDGYLANSSEPWRIPSHEEFKPLVIKHVTSPENFHPYTRDERGVRPWAIPGTPGVQHRIGGLEKQDITGNVSYIPENHERMIGLRAAKVANMAHDIPLEELYGDESGELLLISWGGTFGTVRTATQRARERGLPVSHVHLRWLNPLAANVIDILPRFKTRLVCELNLGQLAMILRARTLLDFEQLDKVQGRPFVVREILDGVDKTLKH